MKKIKVIFVYFGDYLSIKKGLARDTVSYYKYNLVKYINFLKENEIHSFSQVNKESFNDYSAYLKREGLRTSSIYVNLLAIKLFYHFMLSEDYINGDIGSLIEIPQRIKEKKKRKREMRCLSHQITKIRLFCKDCINFKECEGKRWGECKYRDELLKVV